MEIYSNNIINGYIEDRFTKKGSDFIEWKASRSFQIGWRNVNPQAKSIAIILIDHDAIPVCGFTWIHWTVANIDPSIGELAENASHDMKLLEGVTSYNSPLLGDRRINLEGAIGYGGPGAPEGRTHRYKLKVYALSKKLDNLDRGFYMNDLIKEMEKNVIEKAKLYFLFSA